MKQGAMLTGNMDIDRLKLVLPNPAYESAIKYSYRGIPPHVHPSKYYYLQNSDGTISIPRNFPVEFLPQQWQDVPQDLTDNGRCIDIQFNGTLRDYQAKFLEQVEGTDFILNMPCGTGKTLSLIYLLATKIKRNAIILVPTSFLREQWDEYLTWATGFVNEAKIKPFLVTSKNQDFRKEDIVIMSYAMAAKLPEDRFKGFGVLVADECHRIGANTYEPILHKIPAKYRIGLTATLRREDHVEEILKYHFGKVYTMENPFQHANLYWVFTDFSTKAKGYINLETQVAMSTERNQRVKFVIDECLKAGRKPLVLSKRVDALKHLASFYPNNGLVISETKPTREELKDKNPLFGIMQLAKEGMDIPDIDTLILHIPTKDLEQAIGRILRVKEGKKTPLVLIMTDNIKSFYKVLGKSITGHSVDKGNINYKDISKVL